MLLRRPLYRHAIFGLPFLIRQGTSSRGAPLSQAAPCTRRQASVKAPSLAAASTLPRASAGEPGPQQAPMAITDDTSKLWEAVRKIVPPLQGDRYKGQAGKVATIGGCREYTGAPYFASISALKVGADLSHVFCTEGAATVIKSYSPELIVHPYLPSAQDAGGDMLVAVACSVQAMQQWLGRFDVVVVGPGLGREPAIRNAVRKIIHLLREMEKPVVFDADSLHLIQAEPALVRGWRNTILTPNRAEFARLASAVGVKVNEGDPAQQLQEVARLLDGPLVVQKGEYDSISDGRHTLVCREEGSPRRAGGQGDVLAGTLAAFVAWVSANPKVAEQAAAEAGVPPLMLAAYGATSTVRHASQAAFQRKRRSMLAGDVIEELGATFDRLFDTGSY